ncbi:exopolyphosphatase [Spongisporangium articulatum]|uniref:Exopolyphosphatase n=1 Tax=Spongisporangium articulatum TaxID=3362603 RepID=A0ABW8AQS3_9ACTN
MQRVAAVDCGTNSIRLLIADVDADAGTLVDVERTMEVVRLGQGVDRTGRLAPEALERTLEVARRYGAACTAAGVTALRFVATSATRDASNRDEFVAGVHDALGVTPEVIPGAEEAALSFAGAVGELRGRHPAPYCVVDLGGGSTEVVLGTDGVSAALSVDIGCVRLTERHDLAGPGADWAAATADVEAALEKVAGVVPLESSRSLVGLAGSVTTITAHALGLPSYQPERIHASVLPVADVRAAADSLIAMSRDERAALPYMHPGRVDVIGAGALIWRTLVARVASEAGVDSVVTSERDILDGIAWSLVPTS